MTHAAVEVGAKVPAEECADDDKPSTRTWGAWISVEQKGEPLLSSNGATKYDTGEP